MRLFSSFPVSWNILMISLAVDNLMFNLLAALETGLP